VENSLSINVELKSAWPVNEVRVPGLESEVTTEQLGVGHYKVSFARTPAELTRDFVFYYRLADDLPGRVELVPYRPASGGPGTFMMVVTPGIDLQPITGGADYVFVLDVSGSMDGKIHTLARAVEQALGEMSPEDRFRVITFNNRAREVVPLENATPDNVARAIEKVSRLSTGQSTDLYAGLDMALDRLDADRATSVILVTDGVTNTGVIDPREFHALMKKVDVRVFGFVMGNSANWPLMETIGEASGGFSTGVSNDDDIIGQILLAKSKITHEALHDAEISIRGVNVSDATDGAIGKVYRGQQLVLFGRYQKGGQATVRLKARLTGEDKVYETTFAFPDVDEDNPEVERLWALSRIESLERKRMIGILPEEEAESAVTRLGVDYQLVTDYTSMIVLADEDFVRHGIDRRNLERVDRERRAQSVRLTTGPKNNRVDQGQPMFKGNAPKAGGGGAIDPFTVGLATLLAGAALAQRRRRGGERG
jgi:Ca-activated chloride channel family protein